MHRSACWSISIDFIANGYHPSNGCLHILRHQLWTAIHEIAQTIRNRWYHSSVQFISNRYKSVHRRFCEYISSNFFPFGFHFRYEWNCPCFESRWISNATTESLKMAMTLCFKRLNYEFSNWKWKEIITQFNRKLSGSFEMKSNRKNPRSFVWKKIVMHLFQFCYSVFFLVHFGLLGYLLCILEANDWLIMW